jgi:hypothetical protein
VIAARMAGGGVQVVDVGVAPPKPSRGRLAVSILLALVPFVFLVFFVCRYSVDVPYWDEWEMVDHLRNLHAGTFSVKELWQQHNEHRPVSGIVTVMALVQLTHWNADAEVATNVCVGVLIFAVTAVFLLKEWPPGRRVPLWLLPLISVFAFSPSQAENWLWGWQVTIFWSVLASIAGLALLSKDDVGWGRLCAAALCGVVATYSFASGMILWVVGLGAWVFNRRRRGLLQLAFWIAVAALTIASYFYDYHANPFHPTVKSNFVTVEAFQQYLLYFVKYTGAAVALYDPSCAAAAGCFGVVVFAWLLIRERALIGTPIYTFAFLAGVNAMAGALMTGLGRTGLGTNQGLSLRYISLSTLLWVSIAVLFALGGPQRSGLWPTGKWPGLKTVVAGAALVLLTASVVETGYKGVQFAYTRYEQLEPARRALILGDDDELLTRLYPSPAEVRSRRQLLIDWHLSVFRSARAQRDPLTETK